MRSSGHRDRGASSFGQKMQAGEAGPVGYIGTNQRRSRAELAYTGLFTKVKTTIAKTKN
jgi:hypothetical protein